MTAPSTSTQPATASNPLDSTESMDPSQVPAGLARAIERTVQQTFHSYNRSAVLVIVRTAKGDYLSAGSGFIIGQKGTSYLVMTCQHCVVSNRHSEVTLSIRLAGRTTEYEAEKLYDDDDADLAIIKAKDIPEAEKCPVLQFGNLEDTLVLAANTAIVQLGYVFESGDNLNLYPAVAPGTITTPRRLAGPDGLIDIVYTAPGVHGTSGSAVLLNFKVIAMLYSSTGGQILYALSVKAIIMLMRAWLQIPNGQAPSMEQMIQDMLMKI